MTRFLVLGREQAEPTGRDKTSLLLVTRDEPGILYRVLGAFAERGLNMTKIESRPSRRRALGVRLLRRHRRARARRAGRRRARRRARTSCESVKVLGSYPRAEASPSCRAAPRRAARSQTARASQRRSRRRRAASGRIARFPERCCGVRNRRSAQGRVSARPMNPVQMAKQILLVDDDPALAAAARRGWCGRSATSRRRARARPRRSRGSASARFDLCVVDLGLPAGEGAAVS